MRYDSDTIDLQRLSLVGREERESGRYISPIKGNRLLSLDMHRLSQALGQLSRVLNHGYTPLMACQ